MVDLVVSDIYITQLSQAMNSPSVPTAVGKRKISIEKNKEKIEKYICLFLFIDILSAWYCLPDSHPLLIYNPETSSRVTLALLGIVFQTNLIASVVGLLVVGFRFSVVGFRLSVGTVFQTAVPSLFIIPRLRPGLLSLCSVLSSRQNYPQPITHNR